MDQFRKQSKFVQVEETREFENLANEAAESGNNNHIVSAFGQPGRVVGEKQASGDVAAALKAAIETLEPRISDLKLYYFDDLKLKDIAATFGYHEATASRKLVRVQAEIERQPNVISRTAGLDRNEVKRHLAETASKLG